MRISIPRLLVHLVIAIALLSLLMAGCEEEEAATPASTLTPEMTPSPTISPEPTETPPVTPEMTVTPTPEAGYPDEPPELPPSFMIDFDSFTSSNDTSYVPGSGEEGFILASFGSTIEDTSATLAAPGDQSHWNHAAGNVLIWSAIAVIGLAVPVGAFVASFHNIPLKQDDGSWVWSYSVNIGGKVHTAELHGKYIPEGVRWDMYISKQGEYSDFHWYYGESDLGATEGFWILKEKPSNPNDLLRIDWERDPYAGTNSIKYTNIVPGGPENGGYILVENTNDSPYNSYWDIFNKGKNNHTYIEWNRNTEQGRVKDASRFGDSEWHCWDSGHKNIECP